MTESDILKALDIGEGSDWEFKSAKGGLPGSMWETYSGMTNTDGGTIVLGIEKDGTVRGLEDVPKMQKSFGDTINNRGKVNINLLTDEMVQVVPFDKTSVLVVRVPRATRRQRPVFVGQNPLVGTYRRNYEGDYHCTEDEVGRMLADRSEEPADSQLVPGFGLNDLDKQSLDQYRQRFSARDPEHPWLAERPRGLLEKLGGWRKDRMTGVEGLTLAGLLMFGKDEAIRSPEAVPLYHVDYREKYSDDPEIRWTDRITINGTWVANLFQFYQRTIQRLTADLKIPFQLEPDLFRKDDTPVHAAIREALVNAIIHADYRGQGGIVVEKYRDRIELSNPGTLLVSFDQLLQGGISECRNKSLQTMFLMIGGGERAGSGIDKIWQGWKSQHWRCPGIRETLQPDRFRLFLPMVSLLPEDSVERLRKQFGRQVDRLSRLELQALVTAETEGSVSNARLREMCGEHPTEITRLLQGLSNRRFLEQAGQKRGAYYQLPGVPAQVNSGLLHTERNSSHKADSSRRLEDLSEEELATLRSIAAPALHGRRLPLDESQTIILGLCDGQYLTAVELGELMGRHPNGLRNRFLTPMVEAGLLLRRYPDEPNRPDQAYTRKK
ncbi:MAG: putative DNA binding domain-containing protein [Pirellulales bacterium]|nr:putative DNA binding domain-containing protein [Pirellulales bacterium]